MSEEEGNNQKLNDLLKRVSIKNSNSEDEFEKEALEGFSLLKNEEEAHALKNLVDAKLYKEVFVEIKTTNRKTIWLAAAGFIGVIGFSVYFLNNYSKVEDTRIAIHENTKKELLESKEFEKSSQNTSNKSTETSKVVETIKAVPKATSESKKPVRDQATSSESENFTGSKNESESSSMGAADLDLQSEDALSPPSSQPNKIADKAISENTQFAAKDDTEISAKRSASAKKSTHEPASAKAATEEISVMEVNTGSGFATSEKAVCYYEGGDLFLKKELNRLLVAENMLKAFDVILSINQSAVVEKVKFTNSFELNKKEKEKLVQILKSLSKFQVSGIKGDKEIVEYRLEFRP